MTPAEAFDLQLGRKRPMPAGSVIGVAVSGGSDSMALLTLALDYAHKHDLTVKAVTVDHGLRPESAEEANGVAAFCAKRCIDHTTLQWRDWNHQGNVQSAARQARYALLSQWSTEIEAKTVFLGHTKDDQAETVLMALARGSGVDGLAGMSVHKDDLFFRPLLDVTRADLRRYLVEECVAWIDDPSNTDDRYDRVKARKMMSQLAKLGLTQDRLVQTAHHMGRARDDLQAAAKNYARDKVKQHGPDLLLPAEILQMNHTDIAPRVFASAIMWVSGATYRPRFAALNDVVSAVASGERRTLHGTLISLESGVVRVAREYAACTEAIMFDSHLSEQTWDSRWIVSCTSKTGRWPAGLTIKSLGDAISEAEDWRKTGLPYTSARATPGIFDGETLISAPGLGYFQGFSARFVADFHTSSLFH